MCDSVRGSKGGADYTPWGRGEKGGRPEAASQILTPKLKSLLFVLFPETKAKGREGGGRSERKDFFSGSPTTRPRAAREKKAGLVSLDGLPGDLCRGEREISRRRARYQNGLA